MSVSDKEVQLEILRSLYEEFRASPTYRYFFKVNVPANVNLVTFQYNLRSLDENGFIKTQGGKAKITTKGIDFFLKQNEEKKMPLDLRSKTVNKDIFIVHGRDHKPVQELKMMLFEFGLNPIVLHDLADKGRTLIEKLEQEARGKKYAFVILTPDDIGGLKDSYEKIISELVRTLSDYVPRAPIRNKLFGIIRYRARQNVILEFGLFMGLIGRNRVCCLLKGDVERPSDMDGILYKKFKNSVKEKQVEIMRELKEAGYEIKI